MSNFPIDHKQIYNDYYSKVSGYIRNRVGNTHDAEDIVSLVFLKIIEKSSSFVGEDSSLSTWIYSVTKNTLINYYKRKDLETAQNNMIYDDNPEQFEDYIELTELADALKALDERERDIIILHYYKEITLKEIADIKGMSYSYVKIIHKGALVKLRGILF